MKNRKSKIELRLINMEDVTVEQVEWLLYPFIPYGKVTIIQGDPGEGKTTMVLQIIAKLTKGEPVLPVKDLRNLQTSITRSPEGSFPARDYCQRTWRCQLYCN